MSSFEVARADIVYEAHTGRAKAGIEELQREYHTSTGAMSTDALRAAVAQEKLDKTIARHGPTSTQAKQATISYRREIDSLTTAVNRDAAAIDRADREMGQFARGAVAGSGALRSFGRSAAFLSSGFLGGAGVVYAIRSTIKAAMESEKVLGQTRNTVERVGLSWEDTSAEIEEGARALSQLSGFDDERLLGTFQSFLRATKDVNEALKLNALAANVARGADIELEAAAKTVLRAKAGQARGLAILGVEVKKGATGIQLLTALEKNFANAAETAGQSAAVAQERFSVAIENTQEVVATKYLPAITDAFNQGADWLNQTENQERIQQSVNEVIEDGAEVVQALADSMQFAKDVADPLVQVVGGLENAIKLLLAAMAISKVRAFAGALGLIGPAAAGATAGTAAAGGSAGGRGGLVALGGRGGGGVALLAALAASQVGADQLEQNQGWLDRHGLGWLTTNRSDIAGWFTGGGSGGRVITPADKAWAAAMRKQLRPATGVWGLPFEINAINETAANVADANAAAAGPATPAGALSEAALRRIGLAADPNNMRLLREQAQADRAALEFLKKRRANGKITNAEYIDQVVAITSDLRSTEAQIAAIEDAAEKARDDAAKKRRDTERERAEKVAKHNADLIKQHEAMWAADRKANAKLAEQRRKAEAERMETARENLVARLRNAVALAQLHATEAGENERLLEKARREEIKADLALAKEYRRQAHDPKLSEAERIGARAAEIAVRDAIARLKQAGRLDDKTDRGGAAANMQQFLSSFRDIVSAYAPNAFPVPAMNGGKSETHLYELVHETRRTNKHLAEVVQRPKFPSSNWAQVAAQAAFG